MSPDPKTDVPIIRWKYGHRHLERRRPCEDGDRGWSDASTNLGLPRNAKDSGNHQNRAVARRNLPLEPSEGAWPC